MTPASGPPGPTLAQVLAGPSLDLAQVDDLARTLLAEVRSLHQQGRIHGGLAPRAVRLDLGEGVPGIQLAPPAAPGEPRIDDPLYLAPEQIDPDAPVDARADLFALGLLLLELTTGHPLVAEDDPGAIAARIRAGDVPDPAAVGPGLPRRMQRAIRRCLRADPERRPRSAAALQSIWEGSDAEGSTDRVAPERVWDARSLDALRALVDDEPDPWTPPTAAPPPAPPWARVVRVDAPAATALLVLAGVWVVLAVAAAVGRVPADPSAFLEFSRIDPWPALLTVLGTVGGGGVLAWRLVRIRSVFHRGRRVRGTVDDAFFHRGRGRVTYRYVVDGRSVTSWAPVRATSETRSLEQGEDVEVVVDPDRPEIAYLPRLFKA